MLIEFAYAGARARARLGKRPATDTWRMLESTRDLAHYLHSARGTALGRYVRHFTASASPHAIERSLRRDWRAEVDHAARWIPRRWRDCVIWAGCLPDLGAVAYLANNEEVLPWMADDPVLSGFALADADARRHSILGSAYGDLAGGNGDVLEWWLRQWQARWPEVAPRQSKLPAFLELLKTNAAALQRHDMAETAARLARNELEQRVIRLMRKEHRQPIAVFCHLLLTALDFLRLRSGLIRRSLFNDVITRSPA